MITVIIMISWLVLSLLIGITSWIENKGAITFFLWLIALVLMFYFGGVTPYFKLSCWLGWLVPAWASNREE